MFGTIQLLHHFIRTAFGDSDISFAGMPTGTPLQGIGQGNGAGTQIWAAVSSPIFDMVRQLGNGTILQSLLTLNKVQYAGFGFIDDVDLVAMDNTVPSNPPRILQKLQTTLDLWEMGLCTSGGALAALKSQWTFIDFQWKNGRWQYKSKEDLPGTLFMNDISGKHLALDRLEHNEAE